VAVLAYITDYAFFVEVWPLLEHGHLFNPFTYTHFTPLRALYWPVLGTSSCHHPC